MTNKFKTKKAPVAAEETLEEKEAMLEAMAGDWARRMDAFDNAITDRIDSMLARTKGMAGIIDVLNAAATLNEEWQPHDCQAVATEVRIAVQGLKDDWANNPPTLETADTWLDKYVDKEFATKEFQDWEAVLEVCKMNMCQGVWEILSEALDFNMRAKDQMKELEEDIKKCKAV